VLADDIRLLLTDEAVRLSFVGTTTKIVITADEIGGPADLPSARPFPFLKFPS